MGIDEKRKWDRGRRLPEALLRWLREDPWRHADVARVGDRAYFRPDGLYLEVVRVSRDGVTTRVTGPIDAPELGEERTVSGAGPRSRWGRTGGRSTTGAGAG